MPVQKSLPSYAHQATPYAFLSKPPPPPQKKRPSQPLPAIPVLVSLPFDSASVPAPPSPGRYPRKSPTYIATWAAHVQPGSPTPRSPCSPRRRPSTGTSRRPSISSIGRKTSVSRHVRKTSGSISFVGNPSFLGLTETPSAKDLEFDLTALGYTSLFVHLPNTPSTPSPLLNMGFKDFSNKNTLNTNTAKDNNHNDKKASMHAVPAPQKAPALKRLRSFGLLRSRGRSKTTTSAPSSPSLTTKPKANVVQRKKAMYAKYAQAPPLANELALMQFADGGKMDDHVRKIMEAQAKAAAGSRGEMGVGSVYRDEKGGVWWDADEELEYSHLLDGEGEVGWVKFDAGGEGDMKENDVLALAIPEARRGSVDSQLDVRYLMQPAEEGVWGLGMFNAGLNKALVDVKPGRSAGNPGRRQGKARRRPAPLTLTPHGKPSRVVASPALKTPRTAMLSPAAARISPSKARREFMDDSFVPTMTPVRLSPLSDSLDLKLGTTTTLTLLPEPCAPNRRPSHYEEVKVMVDVQRVEIRKKASKIGMRGLFGRNRS